MNAVRIIYTCERDCAGFVRLSIERSGTGDDMVEQFADNLELGLQKLGAAAGYEIPRAERVDDETIY